MQQQGAHKQMTILCCKDALFVLHSVALGVIIFTVIITLHLDDTELLCPVASASPRHMPESQ